MCPLWRKRGESKAHFRDIPLDPGTVSMFRRKQDRFVTTSRDDGRPVNGANESCDVITPTIVEYALRAMSSRAPIATSQINYEYIRALIQSLFV